jgi:predicted lipoprotein with Yx(FWY)xxD motif
MNKARFTQRIVLGFGIALFAAGVSAADVLTGKNGMTLYTFDKDTAGKSNCVEQCLALWPAARTGDAKGKDIGEITRTDGSTQITYQGKPLYYYAGDSKPGDTAGDNVKNVWHVVPTKKRASDAGTSGYSYSSNYSY